MRPLPWLLLACALLSNVAAQALPAEVQAALSRAQVPLDAVALLVVQADGRAAPRLNHRSEVPMNPASVMKLATSYAALDLLGPAFVWRTPVWLDGPVLAGVLKGNLVLQGQGDPKLVQERLWLLLRRVQGLGVQHIAGNIVLDQHAFAVPASQPGDFDGEPLRPYNAAPQALLLNFKSMLLTFTPDGAARVARVQLEPPLAGVQVPPQIPLSNASTCGDYRASLKADFSDPLRLRLGGSYALACGEKVWPLAFGDPASYNARALEGLWRSIGGQLSGSVVEGPAPSGPPSFELSSPALADVIRDINKFSNNLMAQQLFLTLGLPAIDATGLIGSATPDMARQALRQWWQRRISATDVPQIDNGSGLSRLTRFSAHQLAQLLQIAYASPNMPELLSSLPIVGRDGTLKRSLASGGNAHLKTGSLRDVIALAGIVHAASGQRYVLVAMVNHNNAAAARPALDALIDWTAADH